MINAPIALAHLQTYSSKLIPSAIPAVYAVGIFFLSLLGHLLADELGFLRVRVRVIADRLEANLPTNSGTNLIGINQPIKRVATYSQEFRRVNTASP